MSLLVVYVRRERVRHVVDRVLDLVEMLVDAVQPKTNGCVIGGIFLAGAFDERRREARRHDGDRPDDCDDDRLRHGNESPRT